MARWKVLDAPSRRVSGHESDYSIRGRQNITCRAALFIAAKHTYPIVGGEGKLFAKERSDFFHRFFARKCAISHQAPPFQLLAGLLATLMHGLKLLDG